MTTNLHYQVCQVVRKRIEDVRPVIIGQFIESELLEDEDGRVTRFDLVTAYERYISYDGLSGLSDPGKRQLFRMVRHAFLACEEVKGGATPAFLGISLRDPAILDRKRVRVDRRVAERWVEEHWPGWAGIETEERKHRERERDNRAWERERAGASSN